MNISEFFNKFPDEETCKNHFRKYRDKVGVVCKKCGCKEHYWLSTINYYKCKECGFRTSLKSGTVMENSKLPFKYWYMAFMFVTSTKKSFSSLEMQRQLNHKYYEPIWSMMHKIRRVMNKADEEFKLDNSIELDEGFFVTVPNKEERQEYKDQKLKRGVGSQRNSKVIVMVESILNYEQTNKHKPNRIVKRLKMVHVEDYKSDNLTKELNKSVNLSTTSILTDDARHYSKLKGLTDNKHTAINTKNIKSDTALPWVHKTISNAKRLFLGIYHSIGRDYTQNYLSEYCFKFNRRYDDDMFDVLLNFSVKYTWY
ncbi:IS1595 family transposase [Myroides odoratimimus]|uniref:ISXO2-like transposase domain-containing protein n=2 Tax=Myroides odoratimimus TaxID=76832 RepID=A0AAI8C5R6_9FLAO|nr:IS1595 family transposase [Myroides odoratimimus]ALU26529.1 hypothetical protein AS202_10355 [Myroides odoratimimus]MCO7722530.1 IS1595 family transposase [Myroides odoratimimus]MDM1034385.1 IS1595 family transposase [Myroides odoratimimus]MDM1036996.1 IS1595 family transposase [Myroides odoratimimus]MDM1051930.1 IS1595 family transposase [Myroides odoratimimus]